MNLRIFITGGASGLGRTLALKWAKQGAYVCIGDVHSERAQQTLDDIHQAGGTGSFVLCDITRQADLEAVAEHLQQQWQGVDIVVNNAGIASAGRLETESIEQWQRVLDVNLLGMVRVSKIFAPVFRQQGGGYFVNIASQAGLTPIPRMASYNAVKSAVVAFSETMRLELDGDNIGVTVVCPTFFKTNLAESLQTAEPEMHVAVNKYLNRASLTAEQVAERIFNAIEKRTFLITPDKVGHMAFMLKRLLPQKMYLNYMLKQTRRMTKR
ncbi:SDR family oxidoreductase [Neptunicella sp. SCSIO 80796]|uniref:SDR family oxidoreductase n=1 Tax=Neptunicella plasticusilytica TaxID=3117012 RepID=UPI003A4DE627